MDSAPDNLRLQGSTVLVVLIYKDSRSQNITVFTEARFSTFQLYKYKTEPRLLPVKQDHCFLYMDYCINKSRDGPTVTNALECARNKKSTGSIMD